MRALLLAGGLGTRLKPLTNLIPKCLTPIHGRPLLDFWLEMLVTHGISEILVNTHYLPELVVNYIQQSSWRAHVRFVFEKELMGTGGTILANQMFFQDETFLVAHADNLTIFNLQSFVDSHSNRPPEAVMTMMLFETPDPRSCGIVELDERGVVVSFHEKVETPVGKLANAAVYLMEPAVLHFLAELNKDEIDFSTEVIPNLMGRIYTCSGTEYHRDIGTMASWSDAHQDFPVAMGSEINSKAWANVLDKAGLNPDLLTSLIFNS